MKALIEVVILVPMPVIGDSGSGEIVEFMSIYRGSAHLGPTETGKR